jgi:hypothetical protein
MAADITIFDPKTVRDQATFENPLQYPRDIPFVIVNGVLVIEQGQHTGAKPGRVLRGRLQRVTAVGGAHISPSFPRKACPELAEGRESTAAATASLRRPQVGHL